MHRLATLSFAEKSVSGQITQLWAVRNDLSWAAGNAEGRRRADELLTRMQIENAPALLAHVVRSIMSQGVVEAVEIGFFGRVASLAMEADIPLPASMGGATPLKLVSNDC